jgi:hypothetical protein
MQRIVFALRGKPHSGKTTAIWLAFQQLRKRGQLLEEEKPRSFKDVWRAILEIDGVRIGIHSPGDHPSPVEERLAYLVREGCIIIVCAARITVGNDVIATVEDIAQREPTYSVAWITKDGVDGSYADELRSNQEMADKIVKKVLKAIEMAQIEMARLVGA